MYIDRLTAEILQDGGREADQDEADAALQGAAVGSCAQAVDQKSSLLECW